jgi:hypothetical protein
MNYTRNAVWLLVVALVALTVVPSGALAAADLGHTPPLQVDDAPNGTNTTAANATTDTAPGTAERLRVSPVAFGEDWLDTRTIEADREYNTTGPFAVFSLSEPAQNVRVAQSGAEARLLEGSQTLRIDYADDAAETGSTYFQVELFFADGSSTTIDLYATQTSVSVASTEYAAYSELISEMQDEAEERGYATTPDGLLNLNEFKTERVQLVESFLIERAQQLFSTFILIIQNPLAWVVGILAIVMIAYRRESTHGGWLNIVENAASETKRKQQQLVAVYQQHTETANEERISELPEINDQQEVYWRDAFDVHTIQQLANLARDGPKSVDKEALTDGGEPTSAISQINAENIHDSWLAESFSTNRLSGPEEALSGIRAALRRIESKYGLGHIYGETRDDVEVLLEDVQNAESGY